MYTSQIFTLNYFVDQKVYLSSTKKENASFLHVVE